MADLYTSLTQLKMAMNDGQLPPMMAVPVEAQEVIDPAFTIGLGALSEDAELGLRCPIRGCGVYRHMLQKHINAKHPEIGADGMRRLLSIPRSVRLASTKLRDKKRAESELLRASGKMQENLHRARAAMREQIGALVCAPHRATGQIAAYKTINHRNARNACEAQLRNRLIDLEHQLGRSPGIAEARALIGEGFVKQLLNVYGTWNAAKAQFGLEQYQRGHNRREVAREAVVESLKAWHAQHGRLPSAQDIKKTKRLPLTPSYPTILKTMSTESWTTAMERIASILLIYGGRYGIPEHFRPRGKVA